jgi:hypothetical protein
LASRSATRNGDSAALTSSEFCQPQRVDFDHRSVAFSRGRTAWWANRIAAREPFDPNGMTIVDGLAAERGATTVCSVLGSAK